MAKSRIICSASSFSSRGEFAVRRVNGLEFRPKTMNLSHHRTPVDLAPPAPSADAASRYFCRSMLRWTAVWLRTWRSAARSASALAHGVAGVVRRRGGSKSAVTCSLYCRRMRRFAHSLPPRLRHGHAARPQAQLLRLPQHLCCTRSGDKIGPQVTLRRDASSCLHDALIQQPRRSLDRHRLHRCCRGGQRTHRRHGDRIIRE